MNAVALVRLISLTGLQSIDSAGNGGTISRVLNRRSSNSGFIAGLRLIPSFRWFGFGLFLWFVISSGIGVVAVAGPVLAVESLGGPYAWAVLSTCLALGSLVGSVVVATSARSFPWWQAAAFVTVGFCMQLVALTSRNVLGLAAVAAVFTFAAAAMAACGVIWGTEYQRKIPGEYLSRLGSLASFSNSVGIPIGMVAGGILSSHIDFLIISVVVLVLVASVPAVIAASGAVGAAVA